MIKKSNCYCIRMNGSTKTVPVDDPDLESFINHALETPGAEVYIGHCNGKKYLFRRLIDRDELYFMLNRKTENTRLIIEEIPEYSN